MDKKTTDQESHGRQKNGRLRMALVDDRGKREARRHDLSHKFTLRRVLVNGSGTFCQHVGVSHYQTQLQKVGNCIWSHTLREREEEVRVCS